MRSAVQRLRAEIQSDRAAWSAQVEELRGLELEPEDAGALARVAARLESRRLEGLRADMLSLAEPLGQDLNRFDAHLTQVASAPDE